MEELETTWIDTKNCEDESNSPATLGLSHMLGEYFRLALCFGNHLLIASWSFSFVLFLLNFISFSNKH